MKPFLGPILFIIAINIAQGRLGETEQQLVERFGPPRSRSTHTVFAQGKVRELGPTLNFTQDDWRIGCDLIDERVVRIHYSKTSDWTDAEVQLVLGYNAQRLKWTEASIPALAERLRTWRRNDGATAEWNPQRGIEMVVPAYDRAKQMLEAEVREFDEPEKIPDSVYSLIASERVIWLGEMHGSNEAPRLFLGLVRLVARNDRPPVVALEFPSLDQAAIDEFMRTGEPQILATRTFFKWPTKDGRSSRAMVALLQALRSEKIAAVVCFVPSAAGTAQAHESGMAEHLVQAAKRYPGAKLLVLSGSAHSRVTVGAEWDPVFRPAGCELIRTIPAIATFELLYGGGTIWAWMGDEKNGREHKVHGQPRPTAQLYAISFGATLVNGHRGTLFSKALTASPPWQLTDP